MSHKKDRKKSNNIIIEIFIQLIVETCRLFEFIRRLDEKTLKKVRQDFAERCIGSYASSTAFFFFISIIPMLTLLSALIPHMGLSREAVIAGLTSVTPNAVDEVVTLIVSDAFNNSTGILSFSLIALIWSSSKGTYSLILGLNAVVARKGGSKGRNFVERNLMSIIYTVFLLMLIILMLLIMVFGGTIVNLFALYFPEVNFSFNMDSRTRYIMLILMSTLFFMLVYNYIPDENRSFLSLFPGALFSTFGWSLFSGFFSLIIGKGSVYNTYYGSLATIVLFLIWLYGCFYIMMIGAYINVWIAGDVTGQDASSDDEDESRRPAAHKRVKRRTEKRARPQSSNIRNPQEKAYEMPENIKKSSGKSFRSRKYRRRH